VNIPTVNCEYTTVSVAYIKSTVKGVTVHRTECREMTKRIFLVAEGHKQQQQQQ